MFGLLKKDEKSVSVNEIDSLLGTIELIDIREKNEFAGGSIKTAKNIPMGTLLGQPETYLKKEKTYYIMCLSGARSRKTCGELTKAGYQVVNVRDGVSAYTGAKRSK